MELGNLFDTDETLPYMQNDGFSSQFNDIFNDFESYMVDDATSIQADNSIICETHSALVSASHISSNKSGHDLLGFVATESKAATLVNLSREPCSPHIAVKLSGLFFVVDSNSDRHLTPESEPQALACYRRNMFSVSGNCFIPRNVTGVLTDDGAYESIDYLSADLWATETIGGSSIKLVSIPAKSSYNSTGPEGEGRPLPKRLDLDRNSDGDSDPGMFPILWERLQFRTATAKNHRRTAKQQLFQLRVKVMAVLNSGKSVQLCESVSTRLIVRGRSPRSFQDMKQTTGSAPILRSLEEARRGIDSTETSQYMFEDLFGVSIDTPSSANIEPKAPATGFENLSGISLEDISAKNVPSKRLSTALQESFSSEFDTAPASADPILETYPSQNSLEERFSPRAANASSLSLNDICIESAVSQRVLGSVHFLSSASISGSQREPMTSDPPRASIETAEDFTNVHNGTRRPVLVEEAALSYEYIPLSVNDWSVPVDAVYRPHGIHHKIRHQDKTSSRKRYFLDIS